MLTTEAFQHWCAHLRLSKEAQELIATILPHRPCARSADAWAP